MQHNLGRPLRVLIASDDQTFVPAQAVAYAGHGCEVAVGRHNLFLSNVRFDIVHLHWPEELVGWLEPSAAQIEQVVTVLKHWRRSATLIMTVHNLYPHGAAHSESYRLLYDECYRQVHILSYFTAAAMRLVEQRNAAAVGKITVMHGPFGFHSLRRHDVSRESARHTLGIDGMTKAVILVFGALRFWAEIQLFTEAYARVLHPSKHLLYAGRYVEASGRFQYRWRVLRLRAWLTRQRATVLDGYIPDADIHTLLAATDVVIVPRIGELWSGVALMGMTFGPVVVVPDEGGFRELVQGTDNPLYVPGDAVSLARTLDDALALDHKTMAVRNRGISAGWTWPRIVGQCLAAVTAATS